MGQQLDLTWYSLYRLVQVHVQRVAVRPHEPLRSSYKLHLKAKFETRISSLDRLKG
jgi:hypothetical protein